MKILIADAFDDSLPGRLAPFGEVTQDPAKLAEADVLLVRSKTKVTKEYLDGAPSLKLIVRGGVGLDNIDVAACVARGVEVIPATGANALAVAEYVIGTAMLLLRGAYQSTAAVGDGKWPRGPLSNGREIAGTTLGLVGFGGIGRLTARLGRGLGMRVVGHDPQLPAADPVWAEHGAQARSLDEVFAESDVVSLHVPLTPQTRGLVGADRLARMKRDAILVNTARGGVVDEAAVAAALRAGTLGGAALDVFATEPLAAQPDFQGCPNLLLTPHVAGVTLESNERVSGIIAERVASFLGAARG